MKLYISILIIILFSAPSYAQWSKKKKKEKEKTEISSKSISLHGLKYRSIGPALTSGRIADFAMHPNEPSTYYVATASGGVWKTENRGTTYQSIFDGEGSYSIGCVTIDPNHSNVVWVGTGENNNQRSVAYGDGIYKSVNDGKSWKNMGLKSSEHIGKIIVHPNNSRIIYVAAIGPLWNSGGERGVYQSKDGGASWNRILHIDEHTGVNDIIMDPRDPNTMYAAAFQRGRHVYTYLGGGPKSGIYKTTDGGVTWNKINKGLPKTDIGRIGLEISSADPNCLYAIVEAAHNEGGFFRSLDGGLTWQKRSKYNTSGNYYQEIVADPVDVNRVFAMDTRLHVSLDGGKTFNKVNEKFKHVDNHCMWINPDNTNHWLLGCDGGIYETYDNAKTWDYKRNLPITQFYKLGIDNDYPFYNVYGGTQDNFTIGGPTRTVNANGILNSDWFVVHGGDGFQARVDPTDPNIVYAQSQYGILVRFDRKTGEEVGIQPMPGENEAQYRWNWDAPLLISYHNPKRLYFAAEKVFRSDDRGDSWTTISDDLSRGLDRNKQKVMGRIWSVDAVAKNRSTSPYGEIVSLSESKFDENILIAGTDDGLIWTTKDGGDNWNKINHVSGAPHKSYLNDVIASAHDRNTFFAVFNHHKYGDYKPYIFKSSDFGISWQLMVNGLPERGSVYSFIEDPKNTDLVFCGTEFSAYYSSDNGSNWHVLKNGLPTVGVRDIEIQEREDDLILGTFGRGFYVLDDYSSLRNLSQLDTTIPFKMLDIRPSYKYELNKPMGHSGKAYQGDGIYIGDNLGSEVLLNYYVQTTPISLKNKRKKIEANNTKNGIDNIFPNEIDYKAERSEIMSKLFVIISDQKGTKIAKISAVQKKGVNRIRWNMRHPTLVPTRLTPQGNSNPYNPAPTGSLVPDGNYFAELYLLDNGIWTSVSKKSSFEVISIDEPSIPIIDPLASSNFKLELEEVIRQSSIIRGGFSEANKQMKFIAKALNEGSTIDQNLFSKHTALLERSKEINIAMFADGAKRKLDLPITMSPFQRMGMLRWFQGSYNGTPTKMHKESLAIIKKQLGSLSVLVKAFNSDVTRLNTDLGKAKLPYIPGRTE